MRNQYDHLRHTVTSVRRLEELVRQLRRRNWLPPAKVAIEAEGRILVVHPEHDLGEARDAAAHAATALTIAARLMSLARGGTEQPGASNRPRPPVSATALRASASTSDGGP